MTNNIEAGTNPDANLEQLKKQAKRLLKLLKERNPHALSRMERAKPSDSIAEGDVQAFKLADAQLVIARENGSGSWEELKHQIETGVKQVIGEGKTSVHAIDQIWLDCDDLKKTEHFYEELLGLKKTGEVPGQMLFFDCGGVTLLLGLKEEVRPNSILYLNIGNSENAIQSAYNRLKEAGVSVGDSPHCIARNWNGCDVWMTFFEDPACNQLAFKCNVPAEK